MVLFSRGGPLERWSGLELPTGIFLGSTGWCPLIPEPSCQSTPLVLWALSPKGAATFIRDWLCGASRRWVGLVTVLAL